jgi:hypothetical protein
MAKRSGNQSPYCYITIRYIRNDGGYSADDVVEKTESLSALGTNIIRLLDERDNRPGKKLEVKLFDTMIVALEGGLRIGSSSIERSHYIKKTKPMLHVLYRKRENTNKRGVSKIVEDWCKYGFNTHVYDMKKTTVGVDPAQLYDTFVEKWKAGHIDKLCWYSNRPDDNIGGQRTLDTKQDVKKRKLEPSVPTTKIDVNKEIAALEMMTEHVENGEEWRELIDEKFKFYLDQAAETNKIVACVNKYLKYLEGSLKFASVELQLARADAHRRVAEQLEESAKRKKMEIESNCSRQSSVGGSSDGTESDPVELE